MRKRAQVLIMAFLVSVGAAQGPTSSAHDRARAKSRPYQVGTASWYGEDFEGRPTASGELYDMYDFTAAHPTLPLGTMVRVTNLKNRRFIVVRINDRGPIVPGRIIDVSYGAAKALRFQAQGLQRVRLDVVASPKPSLTLAMLREAALAP